MSDVEHLHRQIDGLKKIVETVASRPVKHGKHGLPGRDGVGIPGRDGRDGKDVDPVVVAKAIAESVQVEVAKIPIPQDGKPGANGKDVPLETVAELVDAKAREYVAQIPVPLNGKDGVQGPPGARGPKGDKGEQGEIGPMPRHEWESTKLRFEIEPGVWGKFTDLQGPQGVAGRNGASARGVATSGGSSASAVIYGWFPMGWT